MTDIEMMESIKDDLSSILHHHEEELKPTTYADIRILKTKVMCYIEEMERCNKRFEYLREEFRNVYDC